MERHAMLKGAGDDLRRVRRFVRGVSDPGSWARETAVQALKAGLAAVLAWIVAADLLSLPQPYLAPWVAFAVVRPTVYWSVLTGMRQVGAVVLGVAAASLAVWLMPGKELALAVCVPVAFLVSQWHRLDDQGLYVPFTALFLVAVDSVNGPSVLFRLLETGLGAAIGMGVNLLVAPPLRVRAVGARVRRDGGATAQLLRDMASGLRGERDGSGADSWSAHALRLDGRSVETRSAMRRARDGLRLNLRRPAYRDAVDRFAAVFDLNWRLAQAVRTLADVLDDGDRDAMSDRSFDPDFNEECAAALDAAADAYERRLDELLPDGGGDGADGLDRDWSERLDALEHRADRAGADRAVAEAQAALMVAVRRLFQELSR
ncbi:FUSC family protein [Glycomyces sp. A-F 0318]|uniref:FUSC family protein n=1 Tax=Glycomyces amatae TaxID=2881355 RepID=UPI001E310AF3|nr:FUSC family protein [Glycomyces amatae]MCD0447235.1 FUSC family protein [Glycomyces amatae]